MLPIILGVRRRSDALFLRPDIKPPPAEKILARDNFTCQACGFQAKKFLRVMPHPTADNYKTLDAWVTGCSFCDQCYALESLSAQGSGHLIWLPEIPQATLNHLARAMFVAREAGGTLAELATRAYDLLMSRRAEVKKRLGTDDAATLATVMIENLSAENYADRERKLSGVRVLPQERRMVPTKDGREVDQFPTLMAFWRSAEGPFGQFAPDQWLPAFQEISALAPRT